MNSIDNQLKIIKSDKRLGLMTHVVVGFPSIDQTIKIVKTMADCGVDFIELQIPFSDPLADGPIIMKANEVSLEAGIKVKDSFTLAKSLSSEIQIPILFMSYYNIVFKYGVEKFCKDAKKAGVSGLIIPDMSIDEEREEHFFKACKKNNLINIRVVSPASTEERLRKNAEVSEGFVYCTAHQGITGTKEKLSKQINLYLKKVRKFFSVPIAVGFGISKKEHIKQITPFADMVIIGSAIVEIVSKSKEENIQENIKKFINELKIW